MGEVFQDAVRYVKQSAAADRNAKLSNEQQLALYGAFKQATDGDCKVLKYAIILTRMCSGELYHDAHGEQNLCMYWLFV